MFCALSACPKAGIVEELCRFRQGEFHRAFNASVITFFRERLVGDGEAR